MKINAREGRRIRLPKHNAAWAILDMIVNFFSFYMDGQFFSVVQPGKIFNVPWSFRGRKCGNQETHKGDVWKLPHILGKFEGN